MVQNIAQLNQGMFTVSENFYESVQIFVFILLTIICLLMAILMVIHISANSRIKKKMRLKKNIGRAIKHAMSASGADKDAAMSTTDLITKNKIFNRRGLATLSEALDVMDSKNRKKLRDILLKMDCGKYLAEQLQSDNEDYLAEIIRLAAELNLTGLVSEIERVMLQFPENINVQYEAFLTLSRLGSYDNIVDVCTKKDFAIGLTFRSIQEIISSYSGEKSSLYKALLTSKDAYVVRICVKLIGVDNIKELAPDIEGFLDSDNINLLIDTMRAFSNLRYKPVLEKMVALMKHDAWEVRSVAVIAVAAIDAQAHVDDLVTALQDREWQVRYNAGAALSKLKNLDEIREKVVASGDRFAMDMFVNFTEMANIGRASK